MAIKLNKFNHFVADCFYHGLNVAVYGVRETRHLRVEWYSGHKKRNSKELIVSRTEYAALREKWTNGGALPDNDVQVTIAALRFLGVA